MCRHVLDGQVPGECEAIADFCEGGQLSLEYNQERPHSLLLNKEESIHLMRLLIERIGKFPTNADFLKSLKGAV